MAERVVIVHTPAQAVAALQAACGAGQPIVLQSAPEAFRYAGSLYLLHMFEQAAKAYPQAQAVFILDCGNAAAEAIHAMSAGHRHIRIGDHPKLKNIARHYGVAVHTGHYEALDLQKVRDTKGSCQQWLEKQHAEYHAAG